MLNDEVQSRINSDRYLVMEASQVAIIIRDGNHCNVVTITRNDFSTNDNADNDHDFDLMSTISTCQTYLK